MVDVQIRSDSRYPVDRRRLRQLIERLLVAQGITSEVVVSVVVVGKRQMQELNATYHGVEAATDVLSFPYVDAQSSRDHGQFATPKEERNVLGDMAICYPVAVEQAREQGKLVDEEIDFLVAHGLDHLLGKHHE